MARRNEHDQVRASVLRPLITAGMEVIKPRTPIAGAAAINLLYGAKKYLPGQQAAPWFAVASRINLAFLCV